MLITLTTSDLALIHAYVDERYHAKRRAGIRDEKISGRVSGQDIDLIGVRGEYAVAKAVGGRVLQMSGVKPRTTFHGVELTDDTTIYVFSPVQRGRQFLIKSADATDFTADLGVLVWPVDDHHVEVIGWTTRQRFIDQHQLRVFTASFGPTAYLPYTSMTMSFEEAMEDHAKTQSLQPSLA